MALEIARLLASQEGMRLVATIKRLVATQGIPIDAVMKQSVEHLDRLETLAQRSGKTVKEVADEALALYEGSLGRTPVDSPRERNRGA